MQLRNNSNWGGALAEVSSWVLNYCECACMPLWCAGRWLKGAQEIVLMLLTLGVGLLAKSFALNSEPRCVNLWSPLIARKGTETLHQAAQNRSEQQCCAGGLLYRAGCWCDRHHVEVSPSGPNGPMSMIVWTVWTVAVSAWCSLPLWGSATCDLVCECDTWYLVTICDNLWQFHANVVPISSNFQFLMRLSVSREAFANEIYRRVLDPSLGRVPAARSQQRSDPNWTDLGFSHQILKNDGNVTIFFVTQQQQNAPDSKGFRVILSSPEAIPESCQPCHRSIQFRVRAAWQAQAPQFGSCFRELHRSRKREVSRQRLGSSGLSQCLGENSRRKSYCSTIVFVFVCMILFCVFIDLSYQLCLRGWCWNRLDHCKLSSWHQETWAAWHNHLLQWRAFS